MKSPSKIKQVIIVLFLVLGFSTNTAFAQRDLITTQAGEKIRCRILDETPNRFIYAYLSPSGKVLRNEIFKNLVTEFKYSHFSSDIVVKGQKIPKGLGEQQAENTASPSRVDTKKSEPETRKATKKDKEVAEKINKGEEVKEEKNEPSSKKEEKAKTSSKKEEEKVEKKTNSPRDMNRGVEDEKMEEKKTDEEVISKKPEKEEEKTSEKLDKKTAKTQKEEEVEEKADKNAKAPLADKTEANDYANHLKFRLGAKAGFGQLLKKVVESEITEYGLYQEKLNRGWTWGADAAYFFGDSFGMGVMFNNFQAGNTSKESIDYTNIFTDKKETDIISNKRSTKFVGPAFYFRKNIDFKTMVVLGVAPGAYFHRDKGTYGGYKYTANGMDYGASATLGIDFLLGNDIIGRDIILSLEAGYSYGKMRALNYGDGNGAKVLPTPQDLSRVDLTIGLRFTRYPKYLRLTSY